MEAAGRDVHPQPDDVACRRSGRGRLVDREAEVVEPPDPGPDRLAVVGLQDRLVVELRPDRAVAVADVLGRLDRRRRRVGAALHRREVGQAEGDVLDEDLEVVVPLAVGQGRVDLARLGVDEVRLDPVAVAPEQRVRERAVAPVDAAPMEVDEEQRHRVEEAVAMDARAGREPHQQPPVLERVGEVLRGEDRTVRGPATRRAGRRRRPAARRPRGGAGPRTPAGRPRAAAP